MLSIKKTLVKILKNVPQIRYGSAVLGDCPANSVTDVDVSFSKAMNGAPIVLATMRSASTSPTMGSITVSAIYPTTTGFTCRCFNDTSGRRSPVIDYIALYGGALRRHLNTLQSLSFKGVVVC